MNTTYFLHGGMPHHINSRNELFIKEVLKHTSENIKMLLVYFAQEEARVPDCKEEDITQYNLNKGSKNISYEIADENIFLEQIIRSDIIYLRGGNTLKLINTLKKFKNLRQLFDGKLVIAESAGVYALSRYFYSKSLGNVFEGLGFIPIKVICHYNGNNHEKLENLPSDLDLLLLENYKYSLYYS